MEFDCFVKLRAALIAVIVLIILGFFSVASVSAATSVNGATGYVNSSSGAYMRKSASALSSKVVLLKDNVKLNIDYVVFTSKTSTAAKIKWYHVSRAGKKGYIRSDLVDGVKYSAVSGKTTDSIHYRVGAGTSMKSKGVLVKNKKLMIYLKAKAKGSSKIWYLTKVGNYHRYVCAKYVKITGSIFEEASKPSDPGSPGDSSDKTENMTDAEYKEYLGELGFPTSYRSKLLSLHKKHPKWVFTAVKTGVDFDTVLSKESVDGKSLIEASHPISWRDKGENSYRKADATLYKNASTANKLLSLSNNSSVVIISESFDKSNDKWTKIKTSEGKTGYTKADIVSQTYSAPVEASVNDDDVNVRSGAGTAFAVKGSVSKGDSVKLVLEALDKSGTVWYKIKLSSGFGYIRGDFVEVSKDASFGGKGKVSVSGGSYIPKDGSTWFNAKKEVIAYYLDPRNFLDDTGIFMFENLSYNESSQDLITVTAVLNGTKLPDCGFTSKMFVDAGKQYSVSPVHLASRARQETGGGSAAINGTKVNGVKVYNPFNIGATSSSNPVMKGLNYAYDMGWTTREKAVAGGAKFLATGYINAGQYTTYLQKWNVANGQSSLATHQYMTNVRAPYDESSSTCSAYKKYGVYENRICFAIPVYSNLPTQTSLPQ